MADSEKYPYLFDMPDLDPGESWQDCINPGWHAQFLKAMDAVNETLDEENLGHNVFNIDQLKEKFGAVRMYWHLDDDCADSVVRARVESDIDAIIEDLEETTSQLCCQCGNPATHRSTGWVLPFCRRCAEKLQAAANERHKTNFPFEGAYVPIT